jgi:sigma-B regulation protein RsbU (phosphoserine phosphatase)
MDVLSADGRLVYASAGHNPPILLARAGIRRLTAGGLPLGLFGDARCDDEMLHLRDQDTLVMFTDGVIEALSLAGDEFAESRLMECVRADGEAPPTVMVKHILDALRSARIRIGVTT